MTDEMLALARHNAAEAGMMNVEWLKGVIESIPLPGELRAAALQRAMAFEARGTARA